MRGRYCITLVSILLCVGLPAAIMNLGFRFR
jgi:hypothetical protein